MGRKKRKILIADDDQTILDGVRLILEESEYDVTTMYDHIDVHDVESNLPDLVLLDISMTHVDGSDVCRALKKHISTRRIPVILFSANVNARKIAREVGADDFINKPFEVDNLLNKIAKYVS